MKRKLQDIKLSDELNCPLIEKLKKDEAYYILTEKERNQIISALAVYNSMDHALNELLGIYRK